MNIDKTQGELLLRALENAIRYTQLSEHRSEYDIRKYTDLHSYIVRKLYRSSEMRNQNWIAQSILQGSDLGLFVTVKDVLEKKSHAFTTLDMTQ